VTPAAPLTLFDDTETGPLGDEITVVYARPAHGSRPAEVARRAHRPGAPDAYEIARRVDRRWQVTCELSAAEFTDVRTGGEPPRWLHLTPASQARLTQACETARVLAAAASGIDRDDDRPAQAGLESPPPPPPHGGGDVRS
jgi:hypothetical protein